MIFGEKIMDYEKDILNDIDKLIRIKSVSADDKESAEKALDYILKRAEEMGFATKKVGNIAGHAEFGEGERLSD